MDHIWFYVAIPIAVTMIGAISATLRAVPASVRSAVQHFTAGVVFAAIAGEVIPDILHRHAPAPAIVGFVLGVATMFGMAQLPKPKEGTTGALPLGLIAAVGIDALLDGLVIGISFTAGGSIGLLVTIALSLEMFFLGLTTALSMVAQGVLRARAISITCGLALLIGVGAFLGKSVLSGLGSNVLAGVLMFGCAALLFLVTEELLHEAHQVPETPFITSLFFLGFLVLFIVEMMLL